MSHFPTTILHAYERNAIAFQVIDSPSDTSARGDTSGPCRVLCGRCCAGPLIKQVSWSDLGKTEVMNLSRYQRAWKRRIGIPLRSRWRPEVETPVRGRQMRVNVRTIRSAKLST